jgi:hypothetical protein
MLHVASHLVRIFKGLPSFVLARTRRSKKRTAMNKLLLRFGHIWVDQRFKCSHKTMNSVAGVELLESGCQRPPAAEKTHFVRIREAG